LVSAHREFALDGYEFDVVDFLLKPVSFERFLKSLHKAFRHIPLPTAAPADPLAQSPFLYFRSERRMVKVYLHEILHIESIKDYVRIHCKQQIVVTKLSLTAVESMLPSHTFARIHRSFVVNVVHVESFSAQEVRVNGVLLPVGRLYREQWVGRGL
jgi:DNA-binding LytR/AlgR family response regulator